MCKGNEHRSIFWWILEKEETEFGGIISQLIRKIIILSWKVIYPILKIRFFKASLFLSRTCNMEKYRMAKPAVKLKSTTSSEIKDCRATDIGIPNLGECLRSGPSSCSYALPFGYCFLCKHPRLNEILENTRKAQLAETVLN